MRQLADARGAPERRARSSRGRGSADAGATWARAARRPCVIGVRDFAAPAGRRRARRRPARRPARGEVLADVQNANQGMLRRSAPATSLAIVGRAAARTREAARSAARPRTSAAASEVADDDVVVLYATAETVAALSGEPRLRLARLPAPAIRARPRSASHGRARCAASLAGMPGLHRLHGPARRARAR